MGLVYAGDTGNGLPKTSFWVSLQQVPESDHGQGQKNHGQNFPDSTADIEIGQPIGIEQIQRRKDQGSPLA